MMADSDPGPSRGRRLRGLLLSLASALAVFLMMANEGRVPHGSLWGTLLLLLSLGGLFRAMGLLDPSEQGGVPLRETALFALHAEPAYLPPAVTVPLAFACVFIGLLAPGSLPAALIVGLLLLLPAALRRPGLLLFVVVGLLYLPGLGVYGLWDPWETHYGEVAREILARDDWISLWWAQDGWFWSKPILIFWAEALTWNASGMPFWADSQFTESEWVLRVPVVSFALLAVLAVYRLVRQLWGQRAGFLAGLVLATTPFFALLGHQAITDMYFVANMTVALMCLLAAMSVADDAEVSGLRVGRYVITGQHLAIGLLFLVGVPQVLYLASRNVALVDGHLFAWHMDDFMRGSAGNGEVPGNPALKRRFPAYRGLLVQPLAQALMFALPLAYLIYALRRERRVRPLLMTAFYGFCALAFMGKGLPGFALPGLVALLWLLSQRRFDFLLRGELLVARGALTICVLGLPWFVAMFMRHGKAFTDRLLIHDHINRLTSGVHGDKGSIQYFIAQLGYGMFPWVAFAPLAVALLLRRDGAGGEARQRQALQVLGLWFVATFTLFSAMTTKFHHYIFPAVPAAAVLVGVALSDLLDRFEAGQLTPRARVVGPLLATLSAGLLWIAAGGYFGDLRGIIPADVPTASRATWALQHALPGWAVGLLALAALACFIFALRLQRAAMGKLGVVAGVSAPLLIGALLAAFVGRDLSWTTGERPAGHERFIQLFIYKYERPFPDHFDYRAVFSGAAIAAVVFAVIAVSRRMRPLAVQASLGLGVLFSAYLLNVYMVDLALHWSQKELVELYYKERHDASEPLLAWQMNWKGENLYTGNHVYAFQALDNKEITQFIKAHPGREIYLVLEHKRLTRLQRLLSPRKVESLTTERDNNKFILVRTKL